VSLRSEFSVHYDFRITRYSVRLYLRLLINVVCVCLRIVVSNTYCVVLYFILCTLLLPVSLDCPFSIAPSVFSNVYFDRNRKKLLPGEDNVYWYPNFERYNGSNCKLNQFYNVLQ